MTLWKISGCGDLMQCVVRADTEARAKELASIAMTGRAGDQWWENCREVWESGDEEIVMSSDRRP